MHWRHTFQTRIAGVLALLLLVVVAATYFAVNAATTRAVENQADVQLNTGRQVFERLLDLRGRRLQYGLDWLTADGPFKQAVAGGRTVPILEALGTHGTGVSSSEVVVLGLPDEYRGQTVKAFIKLKEGQSLTADELELFLKNKLSAIERPKLVEFRSELPKTMVGKLSRKTLLDEELGNK